jgi:hypothetical protein
MTSAYRALAHTIGGFVMLQAAFIAYAMFGLRHDVNDGATVTKSYDGNVGWKLHEIFGTAVIPLLAVALLVVAVLIKRSDAIRLAAAIAGMVILQVIFGMVGDKSPLIGAVHGLLALAIMGAAVTAGTRVGRATPAPAA